MSAVEYSELAERIAIDADALDEEIVSFTSYFFHVGLGYAEAASLRDAAKEDVAVYEATLSRQIRAEAAQTDAEIARNETEAAASGRTPPRKNRSTLTEGAIEARVACDAKRLELVERYMTAKLAAERWNVLRDSWQQKGHMLRELVELYKINYFGDRPVLANDRNEAGNRIRARVTT